jgi:hypothetical protein
LIPTDLGTFSALFSSTSYPIGNDFLSTISPGCFKISSIFNRLASSFINMPSDDDTKIFVTYPLNPG